MSVLSFSTMWAQQERFADLAHFRRLVASYGFSAIEVSHSTDEAGLDLLRGAGELPLTSLHAPTPLRRLADGRVNGAANLASTDEAERRLALVETKRTVDFAAAAALRYVVIHLGGVGNSLSEPERRLRRLVRKGEPDLEGVERVRAELRRFRAVAIDAHLDAARRSLSELVAHAAPLGVVLGLESRLHYHELPHPDEAAYLLADYTNDEAGYWHDVGHCEVQARLGIIDRHDWFPRLSDRTIGSHLHDVDGILDHRAPGNGDVDWSYIAAGLPESALRVFEIDQHQPDASVAASIEYLRQKAVIE